MGASALPVVALPSAAQAQAAQPQAPTREELGIDSTLQAPPPPRSRLVVEGDIERGPCPLAAPAFADTRVTFSRVTFGNLEAVPPGTLDASWQDMAGQDLPVAALCEVRDRAATRLREMGYLAAVQIPPQRIEKNGEVRMDVLIARLVEVQVRGDAGANAKHIAAHLARLTKEPYFNARRAERQLLMLSDIPGYDVRLVLKPAKGAPGDVVGDVLVKRHPVQITGGIQNLGSKAVGREGAFMQATFNGLTGMADRTRISLFNTFDIHEQTVVQVSHDFALDSNGLRMGGSLLYAHSEPGEAGPFNSDTLVGDIGLSYQLVRRQTFSLTTAGGLEIVDQDLDFGSTPLTRDHLRVFYARLTADTIDKDSLAGRGGYTANEPKYRLSGTIEARQGISGLGASDDCKPITQCLAPRVPISNMLADPTGFVLRAQASAEYRPVPEVTVAVAPRAQYSPDSLLAYEQFSVGNYTIGRGLDPGTLLGDSGIGAAVELRYGRLAPKSPEDLALQPFVFMDSAWTWHNDGGLTNDPQRAATAGGGLRARWGDRLDSAFTLAVPLNDAGLAKTQGDVRLLFTIRARLLPWNPS
ncbi:ShlB/FhaC/HecB family hemolysin secretion/activation protein [Novosphingobium mangrovi (ex Huang et al. 2023)]|uniref:ShlB/FhaC/HecB family hemolysin secretion/activation protein n=1 Tax=Novosphingobium mangrovi (ex Huang et al. 2023) TaxID=2976432 RepID=A0ABT2I9J0_9SPHN|nr:ShlB/FhaC/HecB family hemolysin secretion/activation protein [Novosphingobium mangrovi (ex Huang et al. 2023)]MCT2401495.1 ShlB/FhaC/HecB family hemolysin secretion/activation protein [Novosphingobium mangrovi (ex Huang et al. 2023)]